MCSHLSMCTTMHVQQKMWTTLKLNMRVRMHEPLQGQIARAAQLQPSAAAHSTQHCNGHASVALASGECAGAGPSITVLLLTRLVPCFRSGQLALDLEATQSRGTLS